MNRKLPKLYVTFLRIFSFNQTFPQDCNNKELKMEYILTRVVLQNIYVVLKTEK